MEGGCGREGSLDGARGPVRSIDAVIAETDARSHLPPDPGPARLGGAAEVGGGAPSPAANPHGLPRAGAPPG